MDCLGALSQPAPKPPKGPPSVPSFPQFYSFSEVLRGSSGSLRKPREEPKGRLAGPGDLGRASTRCPPRGPRILLAPLGPYRALSRRYPHILKFCVCPQPYSSSHDLIAGLTLWKCVIAIHFLMASDAAFRTTRGSRHERAEARREHTGDKMQRRSAEGSKTRRFGNS